MTGRVAFTDLVDWVEGRCQPQRAATVERAVATDEELARSVAWIRDFLQDAGAMPLQQPPAGLTERLYALFDGAHQGVDPEGWSELTVLHDSRRAAVAGVRSAPALDSAQLAIEGGPGRFVLEISRAGADTVDVQGLFRPSPAAGADDGVDLTFLEHGVLRRAARAGRDGRFEVRAVPCEVDELRVRAGAERARIRLDLTLG
ncbi:hypothetical protein JK386_06340 [Nocardioides sp. zg-536]|uniref:Uncharacterized protein n=1 Tax=Nocardioides faecalis TaxID=2803858 RepID=A0A938Y5B2_9ACTN|nr:hypothetical protein [Nocardioides faecalis]MBM9459515.1 hypothetical protein [Nocardioides faecalis]QVI58052.1 hypothetical protein KG111_13635 [Nocardioides faecalis]